MEPGVCCGSSLLCVLAQMESDLLTTYCLKAGIHNICQKLKILLGPLKQFMAAHLLIGPSP